MDTYGLLRVNNETLHGFNKQLPFYRFPSDYSDFLILYDDW